MSYQYQDSVVEQLIGKSGIDSPVSKSEKVRVSSTYSNGNGAAGGSEVRNSLASKFSLANQGQPLKSTEAIQKLLGTTSPASGAPKESTYIYNYTQGGSQAPVTATQTYTSTFAGAGLDGQNNATTTTTDNLNAPNSYSAQKGLVDKYNIQNLLSSNSYKPEGLDYKVDSSAIPASSTIGTFSTSNYGSALPSGTDNKTTSIADYIASLGLPSYNQSSTGQGATNVGSGLNTYSYTPSSYNPQTSATSAYASNNYNNAAIGGKANYDSPRRADEYFPIVDSKQLIKDTTQTKGSAIVEKMDSFMPKNQDIYGSLQVNNQLRYVGSISGTTSIRDTLIMGLGQNQSLITGGNIRESVTVNPTYSNQVSYNSPSNRADSKEATGSEQQKIQNVLSKFASYQQTPLAGRSPILKNSSSTANLSNNLPPPESVEETIKRATNTIKNSQLKPSATTTNLLSSSALNNNNPKEVKFDSAVKEYQPTSSYSYQPTNLVNDYKVDSTLKDYKPLINSYLPSAGINSSLTSSMSPLSVYPKTTTLTTTTQYPTTSITTQSAAPYSSLNTYPITTTTQANTVPVSTVVTTITTTPLSTNSPLKARIFDNPPLKSSIQTNVKPIEVVDVYSTNWQQILQRGEKDGIEFSDSEFLPSPSNIGGKFPEDVMWLRPREIFDTQYEVFVKGIEPTTLIPGSLGNTYFHGAISALAERDYSILKLFQTKSVNKAGCYVLNICWKGVWTTVMLDDRIPTKANRQVCFTRSSSNELWAILLEKAWAKLNGSYAKIDGGLAREVLHDLTGAPCRNFFTSGEGFTNRVLLWEKILHAENKDLVVVASCMDDLFTTEQEQIKGLYGVDNVHPYTILGTICLNYKGQDYKFVKLRNPNVKQEWEPLSEDKYYNQLPQEVINQLSYGGRCTRKGYFLMEYEHFYQFFTDVQICYQYEGFQYTGEKLCTMRGQKNYFKIDVTQAGYYFFQVSQQSIRTERISDQMVTTERDYYSQVFLVLAQENNPTKPIIAVKGNQRDLTSFGYIDNPVFIPEGEYLAFVEVDWKSNKSSSVNCGFGAYGTNYVEIRTSNNTQCAEFANNVERILNDESAWESV